MKGQGGSKISIQNDEASQMSSGHGGGTVMTNDSRRANFEALVDDINVIWGIRWLLLFN